MENENNKNKLTPQQYFDEVKDRKHVVNDEELNSIYDNCLELLNKYLITGQTSAMKKIIFHLDCIEKEKEIVRIGINTFVYRDDIESYIDNVASDVVKIIDLEKYEREIPDEIVELINLVKDKFDKMYIVFTDYTGKVEHQVAKERREKDPILFGTFQDRENNIVNDRFYYIGDWVDEYCDLTLDKMMNQMDRANKKNISHRISTPKDVAELKEQLSSLANIDGKYIIKEQNKPHFFRNIHTFISKVLNRK